jgi:hypothetical protein
MPTRAEEDVADGGAIVGSGGHVDWARTRHAHARDSGAREIEIDLARTWAWHPWHRFLRLDDVVALAL